MFICIIRKSGENNMSQFVVYDPSRFDYISFHNTERGAKIARAAHVKKLGRELTVITSEEYRNIKVPTKTVINLMTGLPVEIPVNTPLICDPSSESYWSA
jgi:hypothetical protein